MYNIFEVTGLMAPSFIGTVATLSGDKVAEAVEGALVDWELDTHSPGYADAVVSKNGLRAYSICPANPSDEDYGPDDAEIDYLEAAENEQW